MKPPPWAIISGLPGVLWPSLPQPAQTQVLALLFQLEHTQWLSPERLRAAQLRQLERVARHALATVPHYRRHLHGAWDGGTPLDWETFMRFPLLTRRDLQEQFADLASTAPVAQHGAPAVAQTSGSTGMPVRVLRTALDQLYWKAFTLREHAWHGRDPGAKLSAIRQGVKEAEGGNWGAATEGLLHTGPASTLPVDQDVASQLRWLQRQRPDYLLSHPTNLGALAEHCIRHGIRLQGLREVRSRGETLTPEVRELCRRAWDVEVVDMYSSNECGYMALQCPEGLHYHAMSEALVVEVIDDGGRACGPGQTGRVVVTTLHNFAMPLIRYEIGDLAEAGGPCACGRGLPVINRILGRMRNMLVLADGRRYWPSFGLRGLSTELGIRQHQLVQKSHDLIEARLVVDAPLDAASEERLRRQLLSRAPEGFRIEFSYCASIPRGPGGKFEDFISEVAATVR